MCLLILKKPGFEIPEEYLKEGFRCNSCGSGMGWFDPKATGPIKYSLHKGYFTYPEFIEQYRKNITKDVTAIIHFRIATHGSKTKANCHPHWIDGGWLMGHNGVIQDVTLTGDESDTVAFARDEIMEFVKRYPDCIKDKAVQDKIAARIGLGNKLVFLNQHGEHIIINEQAGHWKDGTWYSNSSYTIPRYVKPAPAKTVKKSGTKGDFKVSKEYAELFEELVEVNASEGCSICNEKLGGSNFQHNPYSGKCYCNDCVYNMKSSLLCDEPKKEEPKKAEESTEQAVVNASEGMTREEILDAIERDYDAAEAADLLAMRNRVDKINQVTTSIKDEGHDIGLGSELFPDISEEDKGQWVDLGGGRHRRAASLLEDKSK